jgi:TonB family protein
MTVLFIALPALLAEPPETFDSIAVTVVPPKALGDPNPPPPPPPNRKEPEKEPQPAPQPEPAPPPKPEPEAQRPVLPPPTTSPAKPKPENKPPPPAPVQEEPPQAPPRRVGSVFGDPLGASTSAATLGVEDPNFTYGYYLDLVVQRISENWQPPRVGEDSRNAIVYFRIQRDGTVTELGIRESSRSDVFDQRALKAVEISVPLPPLPKGYGKDFLGINLIVKNPFAKGQT